MQQLLNKINNVLVLLSAEIPHTSNDEKELAKLEKSLKGWRNMEAEFCGIKFYDAAALRQSKAKIEECKTKIKAQKKKIQDSKKQPSGAGFKRAADESSAEAVLPEITIFFDEFQKATVRLAIGPAVFLDTGEREGWPNTLYGGRREFCYYYGENLLDTGMRVLLNVMGNKVAEYVMAAGVCIILRTIIDYRKFGTPSVYEYASKPPAGKPDFRTETVFLRTINAFLHRLDSEEEKNDMKVKNDRLIAQAIAKNPDKEEAIRGDMEWKDAFLPDIRQNLFTWLGRYFRMLPGADGTLRELKASYYDGFDVANNDVNMPTAKTYRLFMQMAIMVGDKFVSEDIFLLGIALVLRNILLCVQHVENPANMAKMRDAALGGAIDMYMVHVASLQPMVEPYLQMLNACLHGMSNTDVGFFSMSRDRFRRRYGIMRWEMLNLLFVLIIHPASMPDEFCGFRDTPGIAKLGAQMHSLGLDNDPSSYVSVRELIERMALGPSALYE
jgi:hypothetical protein